MAGRDFINFSGSGNLTAISYGNVMKLQCPVCRSENIQNIWRVPQTDIRPPIEVFGGYFNQIPTLETPFRIFGFDLCMDCESIFLNPDIERKRTIDSYVRSTHYLGKMSADDEEWQAYEERYRDMLAYVPAESQMLIDAACGMGQILFVAKRNPVPAWARMVGLELSSAYVENLREEGFEAYQFDLDNDDQRAVLTSGTADFVSFFEAFEHVSSPLTALGKLLDLLRPGGRLYFSAQRYGKDVRLAIRAGEPIYIGEKLVGQLEARLGCRLVDVKTAGSRYFIILERTNDDPSILPADIALETYAVPEAAIPEPTEEAVATVDLPEPFIPESGHCFIVRLGRMTNADELHLIADTNESPYRSCVELLENGKAIGGPHAPHVKIRSEGKGLYSHWGSDFYFSTSDNTDPNVNGRSYTLRYVR